MAAVTRVTTTWKDRYGHTAKVVFHVAATVVDPTSPTVLLIVAALEDILESKCLKIEISVAAGYAGTPGVTAYSQISDKAIITALDSDGQAHTAKIPGPVVGIFDTADNETIDLTDPLLTAYVGALVGTFTGRGGNPILGVTDGHRGTARRVNIQ